MARSEPLAAPAPRQRPITRCIATACVLLLVVACSNGSTDTAAGDRTTPAASAATQAGNAEVQRTYDLEGFRAIDVSSAYTVDVLIGETPSVVVTTTEQLIDDVEVDVRGDALQLSLTTQRPTGALLQAVVTMPGLDRLSAAGASDVFVDDIEAEQLIIDIEGASDVTISGSAETAQIDVTGASDADLGDLVIVEAVVAIDGASDVDLGETLSVSGTVTGAATLLIGGATATALDVSDAATVERS